MPVYGLKLADGTDVVARGHSYRHAATQYVREHGGSVIAWKQIEEPDPIVTFGSDPRSIAETCRSLRLLGGKRGA